jgi:hypothetical protein
MNKRQIVSTNFDFEEIKDKQTNEEKEKDRKNESKKRQTGRKKDKDRH